MIQVKKIIYTPADIFAMFGAPQEILPIPSAGKTNVILGISHKLIFNTAAYTGATEILYVSGSNLNAAFMKDTNSLSFINNRNTSISKTDAMATVFSTDQSVRITVNALAATGDSNIEAQIIYEEKTLV